jgi:serine O-acetyltransferase
VETLVEDSVVRGSGEVGGGLENVRCLPFLRSDRSGASRETLEFLHAALLATPLRPHAGSFEPGRARAELEGVLVEALEAFETDLARWGLVFETPGELLGRLGLAPHLQATFLYRLCRALFLRNVEELPDVIATLSRLLSGMEIYYSAAIGPGLKIIHGLGTVIGAHCRIGSGFTIYQGATIGDKLGRQTGPDARPVIGDRVIVSAGASVLGPVTVGSETMIAANAVVLDSLPARCVAAGLPAQLKVENLSDEAFRQFWSSIGG